MFSVCRAVNRNSGIYPAARYLESLLNGKHELPNHCQVHTTQQVLHGMGMGYVPDRKSGYNPSKEMTNLEHVRSGFKVLQKEIGVWAEEVKEKFRNDPIMVYRAGMTAR